MITPDMTLEEQLAERRRRIAQIRAESASLPWSPGGYRSRPVHHGGFEQGTIRRYVDRNGRVLRTVRIPSKVETAALDADGRRY